MTRDRSSSIGMGEEWEGIGAFGIMKGMTTDRSATHLGLLVEDEQMDFVGTWMVSSMFSRPPHTEAPSEG